MFQATSDSKVLTTEAQIHFPSHIPCWVCFSLTQMAGLIAQYSHHEEIEERKSIFQIFFHFLQCRN